MTRAADLLLSLEAAGYSLRVDGDKLLLSPASKLTVEERESIAQHKAALVWLLTDRELSSYRHGDEPIETVDVVIDLGDGRRTLGNLVRWEAFAAWAKGWNEEADRQWKAKNKAISEKQR